MTAGRFLFIVAWLHDEGKPGQDYEGIMIATTRSLLLGSILLAAPWVCLAGLLASFLLDQSAWHATDVVVATEGEAVDGKLSVIETWKGHLSPGDVLSIADLHAFADEESRTVRPPWPSKDQMKPAILSGNRMILFLKRSTSGTIKQPSAARWEPARSVGGMKVSVVWVEGEATYAFSQVSNPGPSVLTAQRQTEAQMKSRVREISLIQESLAKIARIPDPAERAGRATRYVRSDVWDARKEAFRILAHCETPAVPILRRMLADETNADQYGEIIDAMASAGGSELGPEFTRIVENELEYWKARAPSLQKGWWNGTGLTWPEVTTLRNRYEKSLHVLYGLRRMKFNGSRNAVLAFRDYWRSLPQLEDKSGLDQMSRACEDVLRALDLNASPSNEKRPL